MSTIEIYTGVYSRKLQDKATKLRARYDHEKGCYIFSESCAEIASKLEEIYCTRLNANELIDIECVFEEDSCASRSPMYCAQDVSLCRAFGRDSGAVLGDGVMLIKGKISSGGSRVNWETVVYEGTVFRFQMPKKWFELATKRKYVRQVIRLAEKSSPVKIDSLEDL